MVRTIRRIIAIVMFSTVATNAAAWGNVKPGDADYPVRDPDASAAIFIHGHIESGLEVALVAHWYASSFASNRSCNYLVNWLEGADAPYSISVPIDMQFSGSEYTAKVFTDAYLLGRCGWVFDGVYAEPAGDALGSSGSNNPIVGVTSPRWHDSLEVTDGHVDAACEIARDPSEDKYHTVLNCVDRMSERKVSAVIPKFRSATVEINFFKKR
jgi:hypothetical protein